jgi:hypothetical protein
MTMSMPTAYAAGFFLTLFPLSLVFNALFGWARHPLARSALLLVWPQIGLLLFTEVPGGAAPWAIATAGFYALRMLAVREMGIWTAQLATGLWAILWLVLPAGDPAAVHLYALAMSLPLVLLVLVAHHVTRRFGAAYAGAPGGLATRTPRLAGVLVVAVLVAVCTPPAAPFFVLLEGMFRATLSQALALSLVWLLWSWAGIRLIQGMVVGPGDGDAMRDLAKWIAWAYGAGIAGCILLGIHIAGGLS